MRKIGLIAFGFFAGVALLCGAVINGWIDVPVISAPANPSSGWIRLFANTSTGKLDCLNSSGGSCIPDTTIPAAQKVRTCEIAIGTPGTASPALADDDDSPHTCTNDTGATLTITAVHCYAPTGSPTVLPIVTGGASTSILTGALTCGSDDAAGTLNGTPTQTNGATLDVNIATAGGTAKYAVIRITRTLP